MPMYSLGSKGRLQAYWDPSRSFVLFKDGEEIWTMDEEPDLSDLVYLDEFYELTCEELRWLMSSALSIEVHAEHAWDDIRRFGTVGVTY